MQIVALIMALALVTTPVTESKTVPTEEGKTILTKIHEDDQITVLSKYKGSVRERVLHGYDFEIALHLAENIPTEKVVGKFTKEFTDNGKQYYQFKSNDDSVWWVLTEKEIGFIPSSEKEYALFYCNNGTTKGNKPCDCIPEWECECEVYDDVFVEIFEEEGK